MTAIPLFEGERIRLTAFDPDRDADVESRWTHDPEYLRLLSSEPARPLSPGQVKKKYSDLEKETEKGNPCFNFAIRLRSDDRLIGFIQLQRIQWTHGTARLALGIAAPDDRGHGYGAEALRLILRYAFDELNLFRLDAITSEYNPRAIRFLERAGFVVEVRRREALNRDGQRWDVVHMGLLREEWKASTTHYV